MPMKKGREYRALQDFRYSRGTVVLTPIVSRGQRSYSILLRACSNVMGSSTMR